MIITKLIIIIISISLYKITDITIIIINISLVVGGSTILSMTIIIILFSINIVNNNENKNHIEIVN